MAANIRKVHDQEKGTMIIKMIVESAIDQLVNEFTQAPFLFFTEADAVSRFHQILEQIMGDDQRTKSQDGFDISLIHREYPTFFRFSDKNPTKRLSSGSRGHYDTVVLNPEFIEAHPANTVHNRSIKTERNEKIVPFQAVVEFKLDNLGWSKGRAAGALAELGKLRLSEESPLRYFVVLMRYSAPTIARWEKYWSLVKSAAKQDPKIGSIFGISWLTVKSGHSVYRFGNWESNDHV